MEKELAKTYDPKGIEDKIYQKWMEMKVYLVSIFLTIILTTNERFT